MDIRRSSTHSLLISPHTSGVRKKRTALRISTKPFSPIGLFRAREGACNTPLPHPSHVFCPTSHVLRHPIVFAIFSMFKLRAEASMMSL